MVVKYSKIDVYCRFNEALKRDEFKEVDQELAHEVYDVMHRQINADNAVGSWYQSSANDPFAHCEGDELLGWKDKGYGTVLELLQVVIVLLFHILCKKVSSFCHDS